MHNLYSAHQIKVLESLALRDYSLSESVLMDRAGKAAADILQEKWPNAKHLTVFCGPGNNGGDGYVLARYAANQNKQVLVYYLGHLDQLKPVARNAYEACVQQGIKILSFDQYQEAPCDVKVDAVLGTGFHGELKEEFERVISLINTHAREKIPVLSIDIPSGLSADTGYVSEAAVKADCTITFIGMKKGFLTADGADYCGEIIYNSLGLPEEAYLKVLSEVEVLNLHALKHLLPARKKNSHKGNFGHVLVVGGTYGMSGSVRMASEAALRVGAGLVSVATHPDHAPFITLQRPEIMCHGIESRKQLAALLEKATVIVIGMGLGQSDFGKMLLNETLKVSKPMIVDADALNLLAQKPLRRKDWVLTPHPGEAARLLNMKIASIQEDRFNAVDRLQREWGGVCVLKGAGTLVKGDEKKISVCSAGNPGMASGGMGDVLSGVIGGIAAQGLPLISASELGVCIHAQAGDSAALIKGERGLLAMDLMPYL